MARCGGAFFQAPKKAAVSLYTVLLDKVESDDNDESVLVDEEKLARDALEKQRLAEREANYNVDAVRASNNEEGCAIPHPPTHPPARPAWAACPPNRTDAALYAAWIARAAAK